VKTVFFDVDTQLDFVFPAGALAVPGAELIFPALTKLTRFAVTFGIQIISTVDAHSEDDPEFRIWKPHCVAGTFGQTKTVGTLLPQPIVIPNQVMGRDSLLTTVSAPQIIFEKQSIDCFSNPSLSTLLQLLAADRYVVYGVATEHCVQHAVFGLLATGAPVALVEDAICGIDTNEIQKTLTKFREGGGTLTTVTAETGGI